MTSFFVPGGEGQEAERVYQRLRQETAVRMGRAPRARRISEIWTRRGSLDCVTTVGAPDPICGDIVTAIFDMGSHMPFVVYHRSEQGPDAHDCDLLGPFAYSVSEFAP